MNLKNDFTLVVKYNAETERLEIQYAEDLTAVSVGYSTVEEVSEKIKDVIINNFV